MDRRNGVYIQWRVVGGSWNNLAALSELKGGKGDDGLKGDDGETPQFRVSGNTLQYKFPSQSTWTDLFTFSNAGGGGYEPPQDGIPRSDLEQGVQDSLALADTALQEGDKIPWGDLTDVPDEFPPETHKHELSDITDFDADNFATAHQGELAESAVQPADIADMETTANRVEVTSDSTATQYPNAKSVWDLVQTVAATIPAGGLKVPAVVELESELPNAQDLEVGDYYFIQNMDVSAPGHSGKAWVNYGDSGDKNLLQKFLGLFGAGNELVFYKIYDQYFSPDGTSLELDSNGRMKVVTDWLDGQISGQTDAVPVQNSDKLVTSGGVWAWFGAALSTLKTTSKNVIGAINELFDNKLDKTATAADSAKLGGKLPDEYATPADVDSAQFAVNTPDYEHMESVNRITTQGGQGRFCFLASGRGFITINFWYVHDKRDCGSYCRHDNNGAGLCGWFCL